MYCTVIRCPSKVPRECLGADFILNPLPLTVTSPFPKENTPNVASLYIYIYVCVYVYAYVYTYMYISGCYPMEGVLVVLVGAGDHANLKLRVLSSVLQSPDAPLGKILNIPGGYPAITIIAHSFLIGGSPCATPQVEALCSCSCH